MASSNTLITPTIIAREAILALRNTLVMGMLVNKQYAKEFKKVGTQISLRQPVKFRTTKAQARSNTNIAESVETFTVATQAQVSWAFSSVELTMTIEEYVKRYITPAGASIANTIDSDLLGLYDDIYNEVGTPGTIPSTFGVLGEAARRLDDEACPQNARSAAFNPAANWSMADALKGTFDPRLANDTIRKGELGIIANMSINMSQNVKTHTTGLFTTSATPIIDGAAQSGATLNVDGWNASSSTIKAGDIFTIANVYAVNPESGVSTGVLKQFVVLEDITSSSGDTALSISPSIVASGAYQTVDSVPADSAALTFIGTEDTQYTKNLVFQEDAFGLVVIPMVMPAGVWGTVIKDNRTGFSIRVVKQYDINADEEIIRLDTLYGIKTLNAALACRITG